MKKLILPLIIVAFAGLYFLALHVQNNREQMLLETVTLNAGEGIFHPEAVSSLLEERATSISNRFHLGFEKLKNLAREERALPTERPPYFVGWDIRESAERRTYILIPYANTNLSDTTNGAWVFAPATRAVYVRLNP